MDIPSLTKNLSSFGRFVRDAARRGSLRCSARTRTRLAARKAKNLLYADKIATSDFLHANRHN